MNIFTALYDIDIELLRYICSLHYWSHYHSRSI